MSQFLFADDSIEAMSMEESTEELYIEPGVQLAPVCDNPKYKGCDLTTANCRDDNPDVVWNKRRYSVCGKKGGVCKCYRERQSSNGFVEKCNLYGFIVDKRTVWNRDADRELLRKLGITR